MLPPLRKCLERLKLQKKPVKRGARIDDPSPPASAPADWLAMKEGIETCLAAMQATGRPAWAALSTSGLRSLDLPSEGRDIIVLADGDEPGEAAAKDCGLRWTREGRRVRIGRPPQGLAFNDLLQGGAPAIQGDTT